MALIIAAGRKKRESDRGHGWNVTTIVKLLTDPRITGKNVVLFTNHDKGAESPLEEIALPDGTYPRVISDELYERILERARINKEEASRKGLEPELFLLRAGFIKCKCGYAMAGIQKFDRYNCWRCANMVRRPKADEFAWQQVEKLAERTEMIEEAIRLATSDKKIAQESRSIDTSLEKWRTTANNYLEDLGDTLLRGDSRAAIREKLNEANLRIEQLEIEQAQVMLGMIDKERARAAYQEILDWCHKVKETKEANEQLSHTRRRDFLRLLGFTMIVEKQKLAESTIKIEVKLPEIQLLIPQTPQAAPLQKLGLGPVKKYALQ
jgi:hypothetical protein